MQTVPNTGEGGLMHSSTPDEWTAYTEEMETSNAVHQVVWLRHLKAGYSDFWSFKIKCIIK